MVQYIAKLLSDLSVKIVRIAAKVRNKFGHRRRQMCRINTVDAGVSCNPKEIESDTFLITHM